MNLFPRRYSSNLASIDSTIRLQWKTGRASEADKDPGSGLGASHGCGLSDTNALHVLLRLHHSPKAVNGVMQYDVSGNARSTTGSVEILGP